MKNKNGILMAMFSCAVLAFASTGCKTVQQTKVVDGVTNVVDATVPDPDLIETTARQATFTGSYVWLNGLGTAIPAHPSDRDKFELARTSVRLLIASGTFDSADLTAALQGLPIKELQSSEGSLLIGNAVQLWDQWGRKLADLDKDKIFEVYILPFAKGILGGLDQTLAMPQRAAPSSCAPGEPIECTQADIWYRARIYYSAEQFIPRQI